VNKILFLIVYCFSSVSTYAQNWHSLNSGIGDFGVRSIYADSVDNFLFVSGKFVEVSGKSIKGIARWNGFMWDSVGIGLDRLDTINQFGGFAYDMVRFNNKLLISGNFISVGNIAARYIGTWDGNSWDTLSIQPNVSGSGASYIGPLCTFNNELYVGGEFDTIAGIPAHCIAKWTGNAWSSLDFPILSPNHTTINAVCEFNGKIYAGGLIYSGAVDTIGHIMQYDGNSWSTVGGGIKGSGVTSIGCMSVYNNELYVGGYFSKSAGNAGNNIQKWNGTSWSDVGDGTDIPNGNIRRLVVWNNKLYAVGVFETAGDVPASKIAVWDGIKWCGLGSTFDNSISAAAIFHDSLYVAGGFWTIDGDTMNYISKWTRGNFSDTCSTIGISEMEEDNVLQLFPNPVQNKITVRFSTSSKQEVTYYIFNSLNEIVEMKNAKLIGDELHLDISYFPVGVYFLQVNSNDGFISGRKFIKF
jgi:hypothetical protein